MKRILFLTRNALKSNTNVGDTPHNLFSFYDKRNCASVYCREELPNIDMCDSFYCISENELVKNILKNVQVGKSFSFQEIETLGVSETDEKRRYDSMKKHRFTVFLWARECIWALSKNKWDNESFAHFISDFEPEIIFMPIYDCFYMHYILYNIQRISGAKILLYSGDDVYSYNRYRCSPLYYINQFFLRRTINRTIKMASAIICLSAIETDMFKNVFPNTNVFQVCKSFPIIEETRYESEESLKPLTILYAGNLGYGRWKTLTIIGEALEMLNKDDLKCCLNVYTATKLTKVQYRILSQYRFITINGEITQDQVIKLQKNSDILLNIESFENRYKSMVRMSFSTKIVDYLFSGRCILSVGPQDVNSISYVLDANACLYAASADEVKKVLENAYYDRNVLQETAHIAYQFGVSNHNSLVVNDKMKRIIDAL